MSCRRHERAVWPSDRQFSEIKHIWSLYFRNYGKFALLHALRLLVVMASCGNDFSILA